MSFNVVPTAAPRPVDGPLNPQSASAARARAIAALTGGNQQPVPNASNVSVEEMSAITRSSDNKSNSEQQESSASEESNAAAAHDSASAQANEATAPAKVEDPKRPLSAQYAQLARKEQAIRAKELALKAREDALKAHEAPRESTNQFNPDDVISKADLAKDPLGVLARLGFSYDELTQQALYAPSPEQIAQQQVIDELRAEIRAVRQGQDDAKKSTEDGQRKSYEQAVNQIRTEVRSLVNSDPELETVKATGSVDDVVDLIQRVFEADGVLLSPEEAAKQVEEYLVEEALKLHKISKIQKRLQPSSTAPQGAGSQQPQGTQSKQSGTPKTLTNTMGTSRQLSSRERALLAFKGQLK